MRCSYLLRCAGTIAAGATAAGGRRPPVNTGGDVAPSAPPSSQAPSSSPAASNANTAAAPTPSSTSSSSGSSSAAAAAATGTAAATGGAAGSAHPPPPPAAARPFRVLAVQPWQALGIQLDVCQSRRARAIRAASTAAGAAEAAAAATPTPPAAAAAAGDEKRKKEKRDSLSADALADRQACLPPSALLYAGEQLGPRPLFVLDHSLPWPCDAETVRRAAQKYEPMLAHLQWAHGVVYIPLHVDSSAWSGNSSSSNTGGASGGGDGEGSGSSSQHRRPDGVHAEGAAAGEGVLQASCRQVLAVLDALGVEWAHFLTYSYGTLVAACMATTSALPPPPAAAAAGASPAVDASASSSGGAATASGAPPCAHRIGSFLSLDTPLVSAAMVRNTATRQQLRAAAEDVNVPAEELLFAQDALRQQLEGPLPCPVELLPRVTGAQDDALLAQDVALYAQHLFDKTSIFSEDGLVQREHRYLSTRQLHTLQHPFQLVVPASNGLAEVATHKEFFGLRRPAVVKSANGHAALFSLPADGEKDAGSKVAVEVAEIVQAWLSRFEPDVVVQRQYEQAVRDTRQLLPGGGAGDEPGAKAAAVSAKDGKQSGKKKKQKKNKA